MKVSRNTLKKALDLSDHLDDTQSSGLKNPFSSKRAKVTVTKAASSTSSLKGKKNSAVTSSPVSKEMSLNKKSNSAGRKSKQQSQPLPLVSPADSKTTELVVYEEQTVEQIKKMEMTALKNVNQTALQTKPCNKYKSDKTDKNDNTAVDLYDSFERSLSKLKEVSVQLENDEKDLGESLKKLESYKEIDNCYNESFYKEGKMNPSLNLREMDDIWGKASSERSKFQDRMVLYCSNVLELDGVQKIVLFPVMMDRKGEVYWCYKSDIFGFHHRCIAQMFSKMVKEFPAELFAGYDEVYKRGHGDTIEVPARMKTPGNDPEKFGNKLLFYVLTVDRESVASTDHIVQKFVKSLVMMQRHPEYMKICLDKTFSSYGGKYSDLMKKSMINDRTFSRIIESGDVHVELNTSLYELTNSDGVRYIMNHVFTSAKPPLAFWSYELKKFCFSDSNVPKGFFYPK